MVNVLVTVRSVSGTIDVVWLSMAVGCRNSHAHSEKHCYFKKPSCGFHSCVSREMDSEDYFTFLRALLFEAPTNSF